MWEPGPDDVDFLAPWRQAWMNDALCIEHPEIAFFPPRGASIEPAKAVCAACPVREECLAYALTNGEKFGIWGGTSERERRRLRRTLRDDLAA